MVSSHNNVADLYSRQIYSIGETSMSRLQRCTVLFLSTCPTALEVLRTLVLSGVNSFQLYQPDDSPSLVTAEDIVQCFWLQQEDSGQLRASAVTTRVRALYPTVRCSVVTDNDLNNSRDELVPTVVVAANFFQSEDPKASRALFDRLHTAWRSQGTLFMYVRCASWLASLTIDFGSEWVCDNATQQGDVPAVAVIRILEPSSSSCGETATKTAFSLLCSVDEDALSRYLETDSEEVRLRSSRCTAPSSIVLRLVRVVRLSSSSVAIHVEEGSAGDSAAAAAEFLSSFSPRDEWLCSLIPKKTVRSFRSMQEALQLSAEGAPSLPRVASMDLEEGGARLPWELLQSLDAMATSNDSSTTKSEDSANAGGVEKEDEDDTTIEGASMRSFVWQTKHLTLAPLSTLVSSIAAHQVLCGATHSGTPITESWALLLPLPRHLLHKQVASVSRSSASSSEKLEEEDTTLSRLLGSSLASALQNQKWFIVGAGAIGCELLRLSVCLGVSQGPNGQLVVTDDDRIEVSNLSRQFLFQEMHVGRSKSVCAAAACRLRHKRLKIRALERRLTKETQSGVFDNKFASKMNVLFSAVDNQEARLQLDAMACENRIPLIDSGTQGTIGHVALCVPFATSRLSDQRTPDTGSDGQIPVCTQHFFPTNATHCIHYALGVYHDLWVSSGVAPAPAVDDAASALAASSMLSWETLWQAVVKLPALDESSALRQVLSSPSILLALAKFVFDRFFVKNIVKLLKEKADDDAAWSEGVRRKPEVPRFDRNDPLVRRFVECFVVLALDLPGEAPWSTLLPVWEKDFSAAPLNDDEDEGCGLHIARLVLQSLPDGTSVGIATAVEYRRADYDKDCPTHAAFVHAVTMLRAASYRIPSPTLEFVKRVSGKIVPALLTTTAAVSSWVVLQAIQLLAHQINPSHESNDHPSPLLPPAAVGGEQQRSLCRPSCQDMNVSMADVESYSFLMEPAPVRHPWAPSHPTWSTWTILSLTLPVTASLADFVDQCAIQFQIVFCSVLEEQSMRLLYQKGVPPTPPAEEDSRRTTSPRLLPLLREVTGVAGARTFRLSGLAEFPTTEQQPTTTMAVGTSLQSTPPIVLTFQK